MSTKPCVLTGAVLALWLVAPPPLAAQISAAPGSTGRPAAVQGFVQLGRMSFTAVESFDAVFGTSAGTLVGGGGRVVLRRGALRGVFAEGSVERYSRTGQQVFVFDGDVFSLGIDNDLTITPVLATGGYRFAALGGRLAPYGGAGIGWYGVRETSEFATPEEEVGTRLRGYHLAGGADIGLTRLIGIAGEVRWASVAARDMRGVFEEFGEDNLGGTSVRVRVLVGF